MTDETPNLPRPPRGRPRPQQKGFDDVPVLSDEEVERRVGVRGGGTPRAPVERGPRVPRTGRRAEKTTARDSLLLLGLVIVGLIAVRVFLPDGPLTASATSSPGATEAANATLAPISTPTQGPTAGIQTLTPLPTPTAGPATEVPSILPTTGPITAARTPTPKPAQTPKPTPKVTAVPTAAPTPGPTPNNRATVLVKMVVVTDSGGSSAADPSDWTIHVTVGSGTATPNDFAGSAGGTSVSVPAGTSFSVRSNNARADFVAYPSDGDCSSGGLAAGTTVVCTITRDDRPRINVTVDVNGGGPATAGDVTVTVSNGQASPASFTGSGTTVVGFGLTYSITASSLADYTDSGPVGAGCVGPLPLDAPPASCAFTYTYAPPPAPGAALPFLLLSVVRPRRWRPATD